MNGYSIKAAAMFIIHMGTIFNALMMSVPIRYMVQEMRKCRVHSDLFGSLLSAKMRSTFLTQHACLLREQRPISKGRVTRETIKS